MENMKTKLDFGNINSTIIHEFKGLLGEKIIIDDKDIFYSTQYLAEAIEDIFKIKLKDGHIQELASSIEWAKNKTEDFVLQDLERQVIWSLEDARENISTLIIGGDYDLRFKELTKMIKEEVYHKPMEYDFAKKYYQLFKYANNAVGGEFAFVTSDTIEELKESFKPDKIIEIDQKTYDLEIERQIIKSMRRSTDYPKHGYELDTIEGVGKYEDEWEMEI